MAFSTKDRRALKRIQLWMILHHSHGVTGHAYAFFSVVLILLSIAILPLEFVEGFEKFSTILLIIEMITTMVFTIDYALRIYSAPRRVVYLFSLFGIIDLLSILPFYLGFLGTQYIKALRFARLLRFTTIEAAAAEEESTRMDDRIGLAAGESVAYVVSRHPIYLLYGCLPPMLATSFAVMGLFLWPSNSIALAFNVLLLLFALTLLWKTWIDFSYDVMYVTSNRLIYQNQHLLGRNINQVNFTAITNVKPSTPNPLSYLLGYGTVTIETAAESDGHIQLTVVRHHERAAQEIMKHVVCAIHPERC